MEHMIFEYLDYGLRITAEEGWSLWSIRAQRVVSEAIVSEDDVKYFTTIAKDYE